MTLIRRNVFDTMDNPSPYFHDETERIKCTHCGNCFALGRGMDADARIMAITYKHLELCEGDAAETLEKVAEYFERHSYDLP